VLEQPNLINYSKICDHRKTVSDILGDELICQYCGMIIEKADNLSYDDQDSFFHKRLLYDDFGKFSKISITDRDHSLRHIPNYNRMLFKRLRRLDSDAKSESIAFRDGFFVLKRLKENLRLQENVSQYAAYLYRKAYLKKIRAGGSITKMIFPATYIACDKLGTPRQINEVLQNKEMSKKQFFRAFSKLAETLHTGNTTHDPILIMQRLANGLGLSETTKRSITQLLKKVTVLSTFSGFNPSTLAAAAVYTISIENGYSLSQKRIGKKFGVSDVSLRNCYFKIRDLA